MPDSVSPFDLTGRTAVVTGARRGIGRAIAEALADAGADIVAVSVHQEQEDSEISSAVRSKGRRFEALRADFAVREDVTEVASYLATRTPHVDILVNNSGLIVREPARHHSLDDWDRVLDVDLRAQFVLSQQLGAGMLDRGWGRIVCVASLLSFQGGINVPSYTVAKTGVLGLVRALSNEWASGGVTVNAIAPGYIATDNTTALREDPVRHQAILDRIPAGRWGDASDLGGAAVFLCSAAARYVTGAVLPVDGGWLGR